MATIKPSDIQLLGKSATQQHKTAVLYGTNCKAAAETMHDFDLLVRMPIEEMTGDKPLGYFESNKYRIVIIPEEAKVSEAMRRCYWMRLQQICTIFAVELRSE